MKAKNKTVMKEKVCKKCGDPLTSTSKYKYCDNCRRARAKNQREVGGTLLTLGVAFLGSILVIKHFVNKK